MIDSNVTGKNFFASNFFLLICPKTYEIVTTNLIITVLLQILEFKDLGGMMIGWYFSEYKPFNIGIECCNNGSSVFGEYYKNK